MDDPRKAIRLIASTAVATVLAFTAGCASLLGNGEGEALYADHCAGCHGHAGRGDGPIAPRLGRPPSDLRRLARDNGGSFPETLVYQVVEGQRLVDGHGTRDMPVWGRVFARDGGEAAATTRIDALIHHLERIQLR
ncbi:MAG: c-type cytochrome [Ectothiorhodospiraceae bacterium]|nr:c-type cytochrome [Chromatiales bacterium]MCP5154348.1 c-type cytochrome [Ectothiorhodospiraceae bacterium]